MRAALCNTNPVSREMSYRVTRLPGNHKSYTASYSPSTASRQIITVSKEALGDFCFQLLCAASH